MMSENVPAPHQGNVRSLAFFMLDKVPAPEVIAETVETCVRPYALEQQIPLDQLLLHYIRVRGRALRSRAVSYYLSL